MSEIPPRVGAGQLPGGPSGPPRHTSADFGFPPMPPSFNMPGGPSAPGAMPSGPGGPGPWPNFGPIPPPIPPTTSGTSTFSFSLSSTANSTQSTATGPRFNGPMHPQPNFAFYPPMPGPGMGQSMMPPMQGSQGMQHTPPLSLPPFGMDSSTSGPGPMGSSSSGPMGTSGSSGMPSSSAGGDRSQRNTGTTGSGPAHSQPMPDKMQSPHSGTLGQAHYELSSFGGGGGSTSMGTDSNRFGETQRLSHSGSSTNKSMHRTSDNSSGPPPNQTMGTPTQPPSQQPQHSSRSVGRSPHNLSAPANQNTSSFYAPPPQPQFQAPSSAGQSQNRNPGQGQTSNQSAPPLPTPPLHHHGSRSGMDQSASSSRSGYGTTGPGPQPPFGGGSSNFTSGFDPPPLHYTSNRPASTQSAASNQSLSSNKSTNQNRGSDSRSKSSRKQSPAATGSQQTQKSTSSSRSKQSSKKSPGASSASTAAGTNRGAKAYEVDTNLSNSIFETRSMTPMFPPMGALSPPPSRGDGPTYIPGNLFGNTGRPLSANPTNTLQHKGHPDVTFNPFVPPGATRGPQNGLGQNFLPGFGMGGPHGNHNVSGQLTPHTTSVSMPPHLPNFGLPNMFGEMPGGPGSGLGPPGSSQGGQGDILNTSPIKFPGAHNSILGPPQPPGLSDPSLQHHHQGGPPPGLYHNRPHPAMGMGSMGMPPGMSMTSLLGQHHHGFDPSRGMQPSTMAPPFGHSHSGSFGMPNFLMHDH